KLVQGTCGGNSSYNNTYFINTGYPNTVSDSVRLDFLNLNLAQPDGNGNCVTDSLIVTGGASNVPIICGENSGQHIYVNFNDDNDITLMIATGVLDSYARSWNIKITQLACDCPSLGKVYMRVSDCTNYNLSAPTGCLMYYTDLTGTVNSFNYGTTISGSVVMNNNMMIPTQFVPGTRELANLNYGVCVQMQPGYCSIQWSQGPDSTSFTVSGDTATQEASTAGLPGGSVIGTNCTTDFVVIPNPSYPNGTAVGADRFCGNQLPTVTSSSKPFVLTVVTDGDDMTDAANRGFSLNYRQLPCGGVASGMMLLP
ncbi:uncharacterized protein BDFB_014442, partial [Asbolus verrucosus]